MESQYRILLVSSNLDQLDSMIPPLENIGNFRVVTAANGILGLEHCIASRPDCVVVEVAITGLTGYQLTRLLRGDPATRAIPIVMLADIAHEKERFIGLASGADYFLAKSIALRDLSAAIRKSIALSQRERLRRQQRLAQMADI
jgi:DNA-binding response OmpR family regulator